MLGIVYAYIPYDISIIFIPIIIELIVYQIIIIFEKQNFILLLNNIGLPFFNALYDIICHEYSTHCIVE